MLWPKVLEVESNGNLVRFAPPFPLEIGLGEVTELVMDTCTFDILEESFARSIGLDASIREKPVQTTALLEGGVLPNNKVVLQRGYS